MQDQNTQLLLIAGPSASGKSASLQNLRGGERVLYLNTESGKQLPFSNNFTRKTIKDPLHVYEAFEYAQETDAFDTIVIDSLTFLMDMYESVYVIGSDNTMKAWGDYQQFFKNLMQQYVASSKCSVIFTAHTRADLNEKTMNYETCVPVKGALKNNGLEAYFSTVVGTKRMTLKDLKDYIDPKKNPLLNITDDDEMLGFKYVFQTRITKGTTGERIRSPMGMFSVAESFMDNDAQLLLDHLKDYYGN